MNMLGTLAHELHGLNIPYEFMRWTGAVEYPYFVGEYNEIAGTSEDGHKETTIIITGYTRGDWMDLETVREQIEHHFPAAGGLRLPTDNGCVVFFYSNGFPLLTEEAELKRIQITLNAHEWRNCT